MHIQISKTSILSRISFFLKWMSNSSFFTSITYSLAQNTPNLVDIVSMASKHRFTVASISLLRSFVCFVSHTEWDRLLKPLLLWTLLLVKRLIYNQSKDTSHMTADWEVWQNVQPKLSQQVHYKLSSDGRIGGRRLVAKMKQDEPVIE